MRSKYQRANLAINCAASYFSMFSNKEFRGPNWKKEDMPEMIKGYIKTQAFAYSIPEKHHEQMIRDGLAFYSIHLENVLQA
jgi:hypothetical protein